MTTELEDRLAGALQRVAAAYVPDHHVDAPVVAVNRRRRNMLAIAAASVTLIGGLVAIAESRSESPAAVTDPPITAPPELPPPATSPIASVPSTGVNEEDIVVVIDPTVAREPGYSDGVIGQHLNGIPGAAIPGAEFLAVHADGRGNDPELIAWWAYPQPEGPIADPDDTTIALGDGRVVNRSLTGDMVWLSMAVDNLLFVARGSTVMESTLVEWIAEVTATSQFDVGAVTPPAGFVRLPHVEATSQAMYGEGESFLSVVTERYSSAVDLSTLARARFWDAPVVETIGDDAVLATTPGQSFGVLLFQASPRVVATLHGPPDRLLELADALVVSTGQNAGLIAKLPGEPAPGGWVTEEQLDRIVLGESSTGRFAYVEFVNTSGALCNSYVRIRSGSGSRCGDPMAAKSVMCEVAWSEGAGWSVEVVLIGRDASGLEIQAGGATLEPVIESGTALDGTLWTIASLRQTDFRGEREFFDGTVTIDGESCLFG